LLGRLMARRKGIAIAGTHGKSTTSAMTSYILREAGLDPSFVIGAGVEQLGGGSGVGDGEQFVVEACEYDRSFLNLRPRLATILNVEEDHLDYYSGLDAIVESFRSFASLVPSDGLLVVNGADKNAIRAASDISAPVETFGFEGDVDWRAEVLDAARGCYRFRVWRGGRPLVRIQLGMPGRHHVANALAATAICCHCGVDPADVAAALAGFRGAYRRLTLRGQIDNIPVVDDYAHHPTEIQVTLRAAREYYTPRRMFVVFQPHQHSRTRFLLNDFARSFGSADVVIVPDIYFVRDSESERDLVAARDLVEKITMNGGEARYEANFAQIVRQLCSEVQPGDMVVTMGAGNVWRIADDLLGCLARSRGVEGELVLAGDAAEH
jgi:UDP-N-acetylmuramate--alanine ligase